MIKLNRIGNKLGLASSFGVLLSLGLPANQLISEPKVEQADAVADRYQKVAQNAFAAHLDLRQVQLRARNIRLARTTKPAARNL